MDFATPTLTFTCQDLDPGTFRVRSITGREELGRPYAFDLVLESRDPGPPLGECLLRPATLEMRDAAGTPWLRRQGVVASMHESYVAEDRLELHARLVPRLWRLSLERGPRAFAGRSFPAILDLLLQAGGVARDLEGLDPGAQPLLDLACQYDESALDFVHRWCERLGITYAFRQDPQGEALVFLKPPAPFPAREAALAFAPASPGAEAFRTFGALHEARSGGNLEAFAGTGCLPSLAPGLRFTLQGHPRPAWNREYLATALAHEAGPDGCRQRVEARPALEPFRPERRTPVPMIQGVLQARIDPAGEGLHAEQDDQGRVRVELPAALAGGERSLAWLSAVRPGGGADSGLAHRMRRGAHVLLAFREGDPDRPLVTGNVPDAQGPDPALLELRDAAGDALRLGNPDGAPAIGLGTPGDLALESGNRRDLVQGHRLEATLGSETRLGVGTRVDAHVGTRSLATLGPRWECNYAPAVVLDMGRHVHFGRGERSSFCYTGSNLGYSWWTACVPYSGAARIMNDRITAVTALMGLLQAGYLAAVQGASAEGGSWAGSRAEHAAYLGGSLALSGAVSAWLQTGLAKLRDVPKTAFIQATTVDRQKGSLTLGVDELYAYPEALFSPGRPASLDSGPLAHAGPGGVQHWGLYRCGMEIDQEGLALRVHVGPSQGRAASENEVVLHHRLRLTEAEGIEAWSRSPMAPRQAGLLKVHGDEVFLRTVQSRLATVQAMKDGRPVLKQVSEPLFEAGLRIRPEGSIDLGVTQDGRDGPTPTPTLALRNPVGPITTDSASLRLKASGHITLSAQGARSPHGGGALRLDDEGRVLLG